MRPFLLFAWLGFLFCIPGGAHASGSREWIMLQPGRCIFATMTGMESDRAAPAPNDAKASSLRLAFREYLEAQATLLDGATFSSMKKDELFERFLKWQRHRSIERYGTIRNPTL
jgi:hypothetical protein